MTHRQAPEAPVSQSTFLLSVLSAYHLLYSLKCILYLVHLFRAATKCGLQVNRMACSGLQTPIGTRARSSAEASFSGRNFSSTSWPRCPRTSPLQVPSWSSRVPARLPYTEIHDRWDTRTHRSPSKRHRTITTLYPDRSFYPQVTFGCRRRHAVLSYDRNRKNWGDWSSSVERERLQREVELQRQRLQELVEQQMRARPAWQTMLVPALGAGFFALLLGMHCTCMHCWRHCIAVACASDLSVDLRTRPTCVPVGTGPVSNVYLHLVARTSSNEGSAEKGIHGWDIGAMLQGRCLLSCWEQLLSGHPWCSARPPSSSSCRWRWPRCR